VWQSDLSDARITDEEELEEIIVFARVHGVREQTEMQWSLGGRLRPRQQPTTATSCARGRPSSRYDWILLTIPPPLPTVSPQI